MTDTILNNFISRGTNAERLAFTPAPPTPASGNHPSYVWFETDTKNEYMWDGSGWQLVTQNQSTSLSQISSSLSGAISSTTSLSSAVSTVDSNQSTSLSQISSSLSGAISSTNSLSTAVSTVISGSISSANSRIDSLSTAVGGGGGGGGSGTSFPGSPSTNDRFYRTDRALEYYYDGTRWLTTTLYVTHFTVRDTPASGSYQPLTAASGNDRVPNPFGGVYDIYLLNFIMAGALTSGTTASNYYTSRMQKNEGATVTNLGSGLSCQSDTSGNHAIHSEAINAVAASTVQDFTVVFTKVGAPTYYAMCSFTYRIVG